MVASARALAQAAVKQNSAAFKYASAELRAERELIVKAVKVLS